MKFSYSERNFSIKGNIGHDSHSLENGRLNFVFTNNFNFDDKYPDVLTLTLHR